MTSKETIDLVTAQNQILQANIENHMDQVIGLQSTVISARVDVKIDQKLGDMESKMDQVLKADKKRNGIIETLKTYPIMDTKIKNPDNNNQVFLRFES